jgi:lysophospholipase L1-like esterase
MAWQTLLVIMSLVGWQATAQRIDYTYRSYGLEVDGDNAIQNATHLEMFFEKLYQLQEGVPMKVNVVHIGDSHIQADYMTSVIRRNFHRHFGNGGRGLIVPLRVAGTNEPNNFKTSSKEIWRSKRCVYPEQPLPIGIGGVTVETTQPSSGIDIFMNDLWLDYSFNALTLFYDEAEESFDFRISEQSGAELGRIPGMQVDSSFNFSRIAWEKPVSAIRIKAEKNESKQSHAIIYGAVLENSQNGILYHTIGVNGARYKHYHQAMHFATQTRALNPDLFIISLGTNESLDFPYMDKDFLTHVDQLISTLREKNPSAAFILVTPQDVFRKRNQPNPGILEIRNLLIQYAVENGLSFYDMYRAMGGADSATTWTENALLSKDGVHLTKEGYEYQGNLFYHALLKGYNYYVPNRHP